MRARLLFAMACLPLPGLVPTETLSTPLHPDAALWRPSVATAPAKIGDEVPYGPSLIVGPWLAGTENRVALRYSQPLASARGTLHGLYHTEGLQPFGSALSVEYFHKGKLVGTRDVFLESSSAWRYFSISLRTAPVGADSMSLSIALTRKAAGRVIVSQLSFSNNADLTPLGRCASAPLRARPTPPEPMGEPVSELKPAKPVSPQEVTAGTPPAPAFPHPKSPTGAWPDGLPRFFRVGYAANAWWLTAPNGEYVYSQGIGGESLTTPALFNAHLDAGLNSIASWSNIASWTGVAAASPEKAPWLFYAFDTGAWCDTGSRDFDCLVDDAGDSRVVVSPGKRRAFPDPFDPAFGMFYRERIREVTRYTRYAPWFVGYFVDTHPALLDLHRRVWSTHASKAFIDFLKTRYQLIGALNQEWGTHFASFAELAERKPEPARNEGPMYRDFTLFAREIMKRYLLVTSAELRQEDPNHMLFAPRVAAGPETLDLMPYLDLLRSFDALGVDVLAGNQTLGLTAPQRQVLDELYRYTGRPIIVSEAASMPREPGESYWDELPTAEARANQAAYLLGDLYNLPYVIGAHWRGSLGIQPKAEPKDELKPQKMVGISPLTPKE